MDSNLLQAFGELGCAQQRCVQKLSSKEDGVTDFSQIVLCLKVLIISQILFFFVITCFLQMLE